MTRSGLTEAPNAWWHHSAPATELALRDAGQEYIYSIRDLTKPRKIQQSMLERRGSHAAMDLGPRHDLSHLSSERFHWTSRAGGCGKAVRRSSAWLDHQDRIHECSAERRLLGSNMAARRTVRIHAVRSHRSSHLERRFSACRLMANVLVSWQSMHVIHI